jgi:hypothetical protein
MKRLMRELKFDWEHLTLPPTANGPARGVQPLQCANRERARHFQHPSSANGEAG